MITNERTYRITRAEVARFEKALGEAKTRDQSADVHPTIHAAMMEGLRSQLEELQADLKEYEALRKGKIRRRSITSLLDLPVTLIEGRIASHMTQRELANKVGLAEQQIQRYESTRYEGVGLARLQEIADAIGLRLKNIIEFDVPDVVVASGVSSRSRSRTSGRRSATARSRAGRSTAKRLTAKRSTAKRSTAKRSSAKRR